jgi:hypothetical protein
MATINRIREEFLEWCKEDPALELANGVGSFENIADWFLPKIDELLKSQREVYKDALIWCSGSEDFQIEGKAREGWEKICLPLIKEE